MSKVSVIVPIYNVESYIEKCAKSLFEQTLDDIEFIFIDDCSPDNSIKILNEMLAKYPHRQSQTNIIKMPSNSGLAAVRRVGTREAHGDYIIHCDSDDWVDLDFYEKLYSKAVDSGADIVIADFKREYLHASTIICTEVSSSPIDMLRNMPIKSFYCMLWNKLMRRQLLVDNCIEAVPGINMWEDVLICLPAFFYARKIDKVEHTYYHYCINPRSYTSNSANEASFLQRKACIRELESFFTSKGDWSMLINYWKLLSKMHLLSPDNFNPRRWKNEYQGADKHLCLMSSFSQREILLMKLATTSSIVCWLYSLPRIFLSFLKHILHVI